MVEPLQPQDLVKFDIIVGRGLVLDHVESVLVVHARSRALS